MDTIRDIIDDPSVPRLSPGLIPAMRPLIPDQNTNEKISAPAVRAISSTFAESLVRLPLARTGNDAQEIRTHIRWMIRRDMPEVCAIESDAFEFPWSEEDFIRCLRQRNCIGMVAETEDRVLGFMIYELHKTLTHCLNLSVAPLFQRRGIGSTMFSKLVGKLKPQRRTRIIAQVRETNLPAQRWLRKNGARAVSVLRNYFEDTPEDAYLMQYRLRATPTEAQETHEE